MRIFSYTVPGKNPIFEPRKLVHQTRVVISHIMAPASLLGSGPVQPLCPSCSAAKIWQSKRSLSSGLALIRASPHGSKDNASVISFRPSDSLFGRRRMPGFGPETISFTSRHMFTTAAQGSFAVDETQSSGPGSVGESSETNVESVPAAAEPPSATAERFKPRIPGQRARQESPTVPIEALVEGAVFTGKVTAIQPFGAFVNIGAFTNGLVHISKMSTGYVNNVSDIVKVGQEVKVTILNVDLSIGRIAFSMVDKEERASYGREGSERFRFQQGPDGRPLNRGRMAGGGRQDRRDEAQLPPTKLSKGQEVEGIVKNKIRSGVFVQLPDNEEGFLRYSEIPGGENMAPESSLQTGDKIKATVLRIDRGRIALSMKPIVDISGVNRDINEAKGSGATNPFEVALHDYNQISPKEPRYAPEPPTYGTPPSYELPPPYAYGKSFGRQSTGTSAEDTFPLGYFRTGLDPTQGQSLPKTQAAGVEDPIDEEGVSLESIRQIAAWLKESPAEEKQSAPEATVTPVEEISNIDEVLAPVEASTVDEISAESVPKVQAAVGDNPVDDDPIDEEGVSLDSIRQISAWLKESRDETEKGSAEVQSVQEAAAPITEE